MLQPLVLNAPDVGTEFHVADLLHGRSLGCLGPSHPLRCAAAKLMLGLILASSVELALDGPTLPPDSLLKRAITVMDIIFCAVFGLEVLLKVVVMGLLFNGKGSYLRSAWNCLDFAVAVVSILVLVLEAVVGNTNLVWLRAFRALRQGRISGPWPLALRPLRAASRLEGIRIVVSAMLKAVPALGDILLVGLLFYFIFAVLFVNLLMGSMFACSDSSGGGDALDARYLLPDGAHLNRTWCLAAADGVNITSSYYHSRLGVEVPPWSLTTSWSAPFLRFDNVPQAIWTLFQMASLEGWSDVMHQAGDATGPEQQPVRDANIYISLLCILFIVVGSFFIINMIIGVTIDKFNRMKQEQGGSILLTEQQKQWLNIQKMVHAGMSSAWMTAMSVSNVVFTAIFVLELVLKCVAVGVPAYLRVGWNVFDALVVVISVAGVLLDYCTPADLTLMPLLRILRLLRVFKLIPQAKGLRTLMQTLLWSLPALANVGAMLMMFMFMYSVMAMNLFGHIKFQQNITRHANFRTFPVAMITLFRCITGENWNALMQDTMLQDSCVLLLANVTVNIAGKALQLPAGTYLDKDADAEALAQLPAQAVEDQCSILPALSILFFISFMLLCSYLLLQLIIAVLQYNQETLVIQQDHMWAFIETWEKLDEYGDGFIDVWELTSLLSAVPPPMGVKGMDQTALRVQQIVLDVDIPLRNCRVHFLECLHALAGRVAGAELPQEEEYRVHDRLVQRLPRSSQPPKYNAGHYYSAQYIKGAVKGFLVRLQLEPLWEAAEEHEVVARQAGGRVKG
ncbi:EF-hand domain-containing protein [Haematococcus lacustris]|uniref:EF-hand domain-containing protein n=1 Tax=Haematococcus lacustris TaxID=44745 RepID=A0A699YM76_HAELA|nr:EF-hand domain-containing protein [Haematococcus lacustris]